jgi:hypothetical protein
VPAIRVELDALAALKPEYLEKVLAQSIGKYFDEKVYDTLPAPLGRGFYTGVSGVSPLERD